jgi:ABC-type sulfate/molybdate transport systems ATPase subunit
VAFGLSVRKRPKDEIGARVNELLSLVRLDGLAKRYPSQLSGGQLQRMALARALAVQPQVLLLDEPFGALDAQVRAELREWLRRLHDEIHVTTIFVTHDQEEAMEVAQQIVVMNAGRIEQVGTPDAIYSRPETRFVADFMGARNILETTVVRIAESDVALAWHGTALRAPLPAGHWLSASRPVGVALRPEVIRIVRHPAADENATSGRVVSKVDQGAFVTFKIETGAAPEETLVVRQTKVDQARGGSCAVGDTIGLAWNAADLVVLRDAPRSSTRPQVTTPSTPPSIRTGRTA